MESNKSKTLMLNTLLLIFCVVVIALFCFGPTTKKTEVLESYNIVFDSDGGSTIAALKIEEGNKIDQPTAPTRDGYIFVGWMLGDELYDFTSDVTGDITLKAKWEVKKPDVKYFTISFSTSGGSAVTPITVAEGEMGSVPIPPTREGFTFVEWQLNGLTYNFTESVTSDITLVAVWEVVTEEPETPEEPEEPGEEVTKFKVKFNLNGGTGGNAKTQTVEEGKKASKPSKNPSRSGYSFVGWYLDNKAYNFGAAVTKDITLVAQWQEVKAKIYYVDVYSDSTGKNICETLNVTEGSTISISKNCSSPTKSLHKFIGWSTKANSNSADFKLSTKITKSTKIYPVFQEIVYNVSCTLPDTYSQSCIVNVSGASKVDKVSVTFMNKPISTNLTADGKLSLTHTVWTNATSVSVVIDGVTYKGKKVN